MTVPSSMAVTLLFMILLVVRFAKDATPRSSLGEVFRKTLRKAVLVAWSVIFAVCCWTFYYAQYHGGKRAVDYIFATLLFVFLTCVGMSYYMSLREFKRKVRFELDISFFFKLCNTLLHSLRKRHVPHQTTRFSYRPNTQLSTHFAFEIHHKSELDSW